MTASFWNIPEVTKIVTPLSILKEQASSLTEQTKGLLVGDVSTTTGQELELRLRIKVPSLNNYIYDVLAYDQDVVMMYPGKLYAFVNKSFHQPKDDEEFIAIVKDILGSKEMLTVLKNIMAQAGSGR